MYVCSFFTNNPQFAALAIIAIANILVIFFGTFAVQIFSSAIVWVVCKASSILKVAIIAYIGFTIGLSYLKTKDDVSTSLNFYDSILFYEEKHENNALYESDKRILFEEYVDPFCGKPSPKDPSRSEEYAQCALEKFMFCEKVIDSYAYIWSHRANDREPSPYKNIVFPNDDQKARKNNDGDNETNDSPFKTFAHYLGDGLALFSSFLGKIMGKVIKIGFDVVSLFFKTALENLERTIMKDVFWYFRIPKTQRFRRSLYPDSKTAFECDVDFNVFEEKDVKSSDCVVQCTNALFRFMNHTQHYVSRSDPANEQTMVASYRNFSKSRMNYYGFYHHPYVYYETLNGTTLFKRAPGYELYDYDTDDFYRGYYRYSDVFDFESLVFEIVNRMFFFPEGILRLSNLFVNTRYIVVGSTPSNFVVLNDET